MELFAGIPVSDLERAQASCTRGCSGPSRASPRTTTEAVWTLEESRHVYVVLDPERAGGGLVTLFVED